MQCLRWGILGTGFIAGMMAEAINATPHNSIRAVGSRHQDSAQRFANHHAVEVGYSSYQQVIDDPTVDVVYIALPNRLHKPWVIACAQAGKHILCEKPFTMNINEANEALAAVKSAGVFCMEAYMYRCHPQTQQLLDLIQSNSIGQIHLIESYFNGDFTPASPIHRSNEHGGGAIMDMGGYCISIATLIAKHTHQGNTGNAALQAIGSIDTTHGTDSYSSAMIQFNDCLYANLHTSGEYGELQQYLHVVGSRGRISIYTPFVVSDTTSIEVIVDGCGKQVIDSCSDTGLYAHEVQAVHQAISQSHRQSVFNSWDDTRQTIQFQQAWCEAIGLNYR